MILCTPMHTFAGLSVVVSAPTGAGKTAIAEAAAISVLARGQRVIYTTPLKVGTSCHLSLCSTVLLVAQHATSMRRCALRPVNNECPCWQQSSLRPTYVAGPEQPEAGRNAAALWGGPCRTSDRRRLTQHWWGCAHTCSWCCFAI